MQYTSREVYEYISKQTNDPITERKICKVSGTEFPIYQSDLDFYTKISPSFSGQKFQIPTPTLCPEERQRRRLSFRNERKLYKRKCDATGKDIISIYSPDKPYKVYDQKFRRSDERDPMKYGKNFDFGKSFTEQFGELMVDIPIMNLFVTPDATENNCIYVNSAGFNKNCYYIFDSDQNENCMFSNILKDSKSSLESTGSTKLELCYQMIYCNLCNNCKYCIYCSNCFSCINCTSCMNCEYCYNCEGLINKKYYIENIEYTKEEYFIKLGNIQELYYKTQPINCSIHNISSTCENTFGSNLMYCKNISFSFESINLSDSKYCTGIMNGTSDLYDHSSFGENSTMTLECEGTGRGISNILFGWNIFLDSRNILYSRNCSNGSSNLFGCIGLRNKQYCIFNKQYTESQYNDLVAKIITYMQSTGERGEFFHPSLSPFGYNETVAMEYYGLISEDGIQKSNSSSKNLQTNLKIFGYKWSDYSSDPKIPENAKTYCKTNFTDEEWIKLVDDDNIIKYIIVCEISGRPYMIQKMELEFYRKHSLSIPSKHPDIRHEERMKLRPGRTLHLCKCDHCDEDMLSVYPDSQNDQKVYCEKCYQKEIYG